MYRAYAGIGARSTPTEIQQMMTQIASALELRFWTLRSGGAKGADSAFERGVRYYKEIYTVDDCEPWCLDIAQNFVPVNRPPLRSMKEFTQKLIGRNMKQILGNDGRYPVSFVICWTSDGLDSGGTGYALRAARHYHIPVYNLYCDYTREMIGNLIL